MLLAIVLNIFFSVGSHVFLFLATLSFSFRRPPATEAEC
jgi:hypothetical protein